MIVCVCVCVLCVCVLCGLVVVFGNFALEEKKDTVKSFYPILRQGGVTYVLCGQINE